jgi:transposase-like protein
LRKRLEEVSLDLVKDFAEARMGAEADTLCGAAYWGALSARITIRNGYESGQGGSRVGTRVGVRVGVIELAIPKHASPYWPEGALRSGLRFTKRACLVIG